MRREITLYTDRMKIRPAELGDIDWIIELENHPAVKPYSWTGDYDDHRSEIESDKYLLYVFEKINGDRVGYCLVELNFKANSYLLRRIAFTERNKGLGHEAMWALMKDCFERMEMNRFWLDVFPDNYAGVRLYEKMGMTKEGVLRENDRQDRGYLDQIVYGMLKDEWKEFKKQFKS